MEPVRTAPRTIAAGCPPGISTRQDQGGSTSTNLPKALSHALPCT